MSPGAVNGALLDAQGHEIEPANPGKTHSYSAVFATRPAPGATLTNPHRVDPSVVITPPIPGTWSVSKVLATIPTGQPVEDSASPIPYFHILERLKTTRREGWRRFGIYPGESIADHMYRMAMIAMLPPPALSSRLDRNKCIRMCLVHDMAESLVGDITPVDGVPKTEKNRREATAMDFLTGPLLRNVWGGSGAATGKEVRALWQEYEDASTLDSHFVHDVDKIDLLLQMVEYEKRGGKKLDLGEFANVARRMTLEEMKLWAQELLREREEFWGDRDHVHGEDGARGGISRGHLLAQDQYYNHAGADTPS